MGPRPAHLKLNSDDSTNDPPLPPQRPFFQYGDLPSPRAGEVPPALSPLDAIAMHSRMLAKRFEDSEQKGRRISRLQHADVAKELSNRPGYFRNVSNESEGTMSDVPEEASPTSPQKGELTMQEADEKNRPVSHYPMLGNAGKSSRPGTALSTAYEEDDGVGTPYQEFYDAQEGQGKQKEPDYFGIAVPRASSPEPVDPKTINVQIASPIGMPSLTHSIDSVQSTQPRTLTDGSTKSNRSLAPPKSPAYPKSPRSMHSIRSVPPDSGDEEASTSGSYAVSSSRKFSGSSNMSRPQSPFSPFTQPVHRSPSMTSEYSINGSQRRTNFSRPLSSSSQRPPIDPRRSFESRSSVETGRSLDVAHRHPSAASGSVHLSSGAPSRQPSGDDVATPFATPPQSEAPGLAVGGEVQNVEAKTSEPNQYTYATYTLPRGRVVDRNSRGKRDSWIQKQFTWDDASPADYDLTIPEESASRPATANVSPAAAPAPPFTAPEGKSSMTRSRDPSQEQPQLGIERSHSQPEQSTLASVSRTTSYEQAEPPFQKPFAQEDRPSSADSWRDSIRFPRERSGSPFRKPWVERPPSAGSDKGEREGRSRGFSSGNRSHSADSRTFQKSSALHKSSTSIKTHNTDSTDKTIKATPLHERSGSAELTPDEHLDIGIAAHSSGQLSKSTYHLRLAAHAGLPTAMLLYALACRHGWGMRPNQADGVAWLRKAIDGSGLEVADIEGTLSSATAGKNLDPVSEAQERKKRKAQFALAVYELGISYMNGWGCPKDKPLAVQCYEVAGNWGDCDALAEAGFCYTQGLGVKKDLRKAAGLYRRAAEGGMSMAGNSWYVLDIHLSYFNRGEVMAITDYLRQQDLQTQIHGRKLRDVGRKDRRARAREEEESRHGRERCEQGVRREGSQESVPCEEYLGAEEEFCRVMLSFLCYVGRRSERWRGKEWDGLATAGLGCFDF